MIDREKFFDELEIWLGTELNMSKPRKPTEKFHIFFSYVEADRWVNQAVSYVDKSISRQNFKKVLEKALNGNTNT